MKITSHGAAQGVTGSKHLIELNGYRILLDCGMFQGRRKESDYKNRHIPLEPETLDAVVLSHAHIDHSGVIPVLGKMGYRGRIYSTCATRDLCTIMLLDSANIQRRDAEWLSKKKQTYIAPLYDDTDVYLAMKQFVCIPYEERMEVLPGIFLTLQDAGHVLGSAIVCLDYKENGASKRLVFSGDLGRKNLPILKDPWEPSDADVVIMESTYGDRDHDPIETMEGELADVICRTHARGGKLIIPSFALERAQEIIYALKRLEVRQAVPFQHVYVDSPLTVNVTEMFRLHTECFDSEIQQLMAKVGDPFLLNHVQYVRSAEDSIRLNYQPGPAIIISAAGMCEHGRILHHLRNNCEDSKNTILIVGFQAKHTLGRRIVERRREIRIFGKNYELNAEVKVMNAFSAHAGRSELIEWGKRFGINGTRMLLVHGEETALDALKSGLEDEGLSDITIQQEGVPIEID
ncbi:MAG: MBL fold metallo-hydrolase [Nitrospiraceae bacterium]|nr:MBL fold metallo-hydrolase [Nitrospiraceae bacterium]